MIAEPKSIDNWQIAHIYLDPSLTMSATVMKGFVGGKSIRTSPILWLDLEKRVAMTEYEIFKVGEPNRQWISVFLASGNSLEDLEIKDTTQ